VQPNEESIIPGMIPQPVSIITGHSLGDDIQWGGGQDSFYEVCNPLVVFLFRLFPLSFVPCVNSLSTNFVEVCVFFRIAGSSGVNN
jgi:hypothetical protein